MFCVWGDIRVGLVLAGKQLAIEWGKKGDGRCAKGEEKLREGESRSREYLGCWEGIG